MEPEVGGVSMRAVLRTVVFPDPLSPASPNTSPFLTSKLTSSTACTMSAFVLLNDWRNVRLTGKNFDRCSTCSTSSLSSVTPSHLAGL